MKKEDLSLGSAVALLACGNVMVADYGLASLLFMPFFPVACLYGIGWNLIIMYRCIRSRNWKLLRKQLLLLALAYMTFVIIVLHGHCHLYGIGGGL